MMDSSLAIKPLRIRQGETNGGSGARPSLASVRQLPLPNKQEDHAMNLPRRVRAAALALVALSLGSASAVPLAAQPGATPPAGCTGPVSATWLNVVVEGVRNGNGLIAITLYADIPSKFLVRKGSLYVGRVDATAGTTRGCIFVPKPGVYAVAIYHDEDGDQALDRSGIGLPTEGFGFSNNAPTLAGLPQFKAVRLNVAKTGLTSRISLRYP